MRMGFLNATWAAVSFLAIGWLAAPAAAQLSGVGQVLERANQAAASASGTKSAEEFRAWASSYVDNPQGNIMLPKEWFDQHFDANTARMLKAEYQAGTSMVATLPQLVRKQRAQGKTNLVVSVHTKAIDTTATGWQNAALQRMTKPTSLYSLRMTQPGGKSGFALVSFVYAEGRFAFAGKLSALHDPQGDDATKLLCANPIAAAEKFLKSKGLIQSSGVEHLRKAGVLK